MWDVAGEGRAGQLQWAVANSLPASDGWGGDDFTPQKCRNQENNPTWDGAGKWAASWRRGGVRDLCWDQRPRWVAGDGAS